MMTTDGLSWLQRDHGYYEGSPVMQRAEHLLEEGYEPQKRKDMCSN